MSSDPKTDYKKSVQKNDYGPGAQSSVLNFWLPYYSQVEALPPQLPEKSRERDRVLMSTMEHESFWAGAVGIEASKFAASSWTLKSERPRIQERFQNLLLHATVGAVSGWVPFASTGFASYANTGKWVVEIERYTTRAGSRIKALHHLPIERCTLTNDPARPVVYQDSKGALHELRDYNVMVFVDLPNARLGKQNSPYSAAMRAYDAIVQMAALKLYLYEKVSGRRPLAFHFLQGINDKTLRTAIENAQDTADSRGIQSYMGAVMSAIMGDTPLNLVTVPLAEIPDGVDVDQMRKYIHLEYANALGEDPTRIDPQLIGNRQLGAGAQATVLDQKARQGGVQVALKANVTHEILGLLRAEKIQFAFVESDLRDDRQRAEVQKLRAETRRLQIESGEITPQQAANMAVDTGDMPAEFLPEDETDFGVITDADQPKQTTKAVTTRAIDPRDAKSISTLVGAEIDAAAEIYRRVSNAE